MTNRGTLKMWATRSMRSSASVALARCHFRLASPRNKTTPVGVALASNRARILATRRAIFFRFPPSNVAMTAAINSASDSSVIARPGNGFCTLKLPVTSPPGEATNGAHYGKAVESNFNQNVNFQIAPVLPRRVTVRNSPPARFSPVGAPLPTGAFYSETRRAARFRPASGPSVDSPPDPLGPNPSTAKGAPLQDAPLCQPVSSLNLARPPREARQSLPMQGVRVPPVKLPADDLLRHEVHGHQLAQSLVSMPARSSERPCSVSPQ